MGTKHTPGPWHTDTGGAGCEFVIENQNQGYGAYTIAEIPEYLESDYTRETIAANAQLIAAAPELLEALELFVEDFTERNEPSTWMPGERAVVEQSRKAIAKAKGETNA